VSAIVEQVRAARGASGPNVEYVRRLAESLRELGAHDPHVFALDARLAIP
jgi:cation transport regulator ChaC